MRPEPADDLASLHLHYLDEGRAGARKQAPAFLVQAGAAVTTRCHLTLEDFLAGCKVPNGEETPSGGQALPVRAERQAIQPFAGNLQINRCLRSVEVPDFRGTAGRHQPLTVWAERKTV